MNDNAYKSNLSTMFKNLGLKPLVQLCHPKESPPATFEGNTNRVTIEEIWGTESVDVIRAGFMPFDSDSMVVAPSDGHRMLWVEISNASILGKHISHSFESN